VRLNAALDFPSSHGTALDDRCDRQALKGFVMRGRKRVFPRIHVLSIDRALS
jgi:hypothetical protein